MSDADITTIQTTEEDEAEVINPYNNIALYRGQMETAEQEYISLYAHGDETELYNVDLFNGLMDYINYTVFKPDKRSKQYAVNNYNKSTNSVIDYSDADTIYKLFTLYKLLCAKYKKAYVRQQFCSMTGITRDTFTRWLNGDTRGASPAHCDLAKKIQADCESILAGKVINTNSIGSMFVLKCGYGWHEDQHVVIETANSRHDSAEQIAARHAQAALPEKPTFEDE